MARSIQEIQNQMLLLKQSTPELSALDSTSRASVWRLWIYIVAASIWTLENLFDIHKKELYTALYELKPHTARWYRNKALAFLYGFDLYVDSDIYDTTGATDEQLESAAVVKYAAVVESEDISRLIIKIAGENAEGVLSPIPNDVKTSFDYYMTEVRDAGVRLTIINYLPDLLKLNLTIKRDPLVLDENGLNILTATEPVKDAIKEFMKELPFNGQLSLQKLTDKIQAVPGVLDININTAETAWIDADANDYGNFEMIYMSQIPVSGYFAVELEDDQDNNYSVINYV